MESQVAMTLPLALPDPNKQTFPVLSPAFPVLTSPQQGMAVIYQSTPSPTTKATGVNYDSQGKSGAIELPQIYEGQAGGMGEDVSNTNKDALKPSLPRVKQSQYFEDDDLGDDLTQRIHTTHPLPYQYKNFRSSVQMKTVPLTKRHRDLFANHQDHLYPSSIAKTRVQPVHTRPFLWSQHKAEETVKSPTNGNTGSKNPENLPLPDKFLAKEKHLKKMRGYKRRYSVPQHRKGFNDLHVGGQAPTLASRHDYRGEMTNLRNTVVPSDIQALYTGKGFNLPVSHTSVRKREEWQANLKAEYTLPNSAPAAVVLPTTTDMTDTEDSARSLSADGDNPSSPTHKLTTHKTSSRKHKQAAKPAAVVSTDHNMLGVGMDKKVDNDRGSDLVNRRVAGRGVHAKSDGKQTTKQPRVPKPKPKLEKKPNKYAGALPKLQTDTPSTEDLNNDMDMEELSNSDADRHEPSVEIAIDSPDIVSPEQTKEEESTRPESEMEIEMTPDDPHNKLRIMYSPTTPKAVSPNPLKCADLTLNISDEKREELSAAFRKLDSDQDGHISIAELQTTLPDTLTRGQCMFIKEVYELVSSSTFFGMNEYVTVTCLCEEMVKLPDTLKAPYEEIDNSVLEQLISQYVILFATVDRQQTGSISLDALKEILTMALDKDLNIHTQLYATILETIDKEYSSGISKVEYLSFLPYFFICMK